MRISYSSKSIKKRVFIGKRDWKKYKIGIYNMSKEQFKYEEAQNGILWKSHYGDIFKFIDIDCLAQLSSKSLIT